MLFFHILFAFAYFLQTHFRSHLYLHSIKLKYTSLVQILRTASRHSRATAWPAVTMAPLHNYTWFIYVLTFLLLMAISLILLLIAVKCLQACAYTSVMCFRRRRGRRRRRSATTDSSCSSAKICNCFFSLILITKYITKDFNFAHLHYQF